jgi:hypothetical protein
MQWSWEHLAERIRFIRQVRSQSAPVFTLRAEDHDGGMLGSKKKGTMSLVDKVCYVSAKECMQTYLAAT